LNSVQSPPGLPIERFMARKYLEPAPEEWRTPVFLFEGIDKRELSAGLSEISLFSLADRKIGLLS
jgi:hypothetical protein